MTRRRIEKFDYSPAAAIQSLAVSRNKIRPSNLKVKEKKRGNRYEELFSFSSDAVLSDDGNRMESLNDQETTLPVRVAIVIKWNVKSCNYRTLAVVWASLLLAKPTKIQSENETRKMLLID